MTQPAPAPRQAAEAGPRPPRHQITVHGPLALFAARLASLPAGEYVIRLDTTHAARPRWQISQPGPWEKAHREEGA